MNARQGLGTFDGVFTPTILTILGVIMYLRLGWVVGNAGFVGTLIIIVLAHTITVCTALSMASVVSNIEIGAGGAYAIVSRSLGLEVGGAVGIPLYLSQAFSVAFYIIGFTELWHSFFPGHSTVLVGVATWVALTALSLASARTAFRVQYVVLGAIVLSVASFLAGPSLNTAGTLWWSNFPQANFWETFAIFFPAVTGILAGVSMSGELRTPRRSIIVGTLAAIALGMVTYIALAYWFAHQATGEALLADTSIILELALFKPLIVAGIMGATLSSALSTLVGAPRTLAALADNRLVPFSQFFGKKAADNEPRNAILVSSLFSLAIIVAGSLDQLAQLLTMFFLTTYGTINLVVLVEQATGIASFRPRLRVSLAVPFIGFVGSILTMLLIDMWFTIVTLVVISALYILLARRELISPWGDVRGGIFTALTEWAAQKALSTTYHPRLWKPAVLVPAENPDDLRKTVRFVSNILYPSGRMYLLSITNGDKNATARCYEDVLEPLRRKNLFIRTTIISNANADFLSSLYVVTQTLLNSFLPPNAVFLTVSGDKDKRARLKEVYANMRQYNTGFMFLNIHPKIGFGQERTINLWLRDKSPNTNLAVLLAMQLTRNWDAKLFLLRTIGDPAEREEVTGELQAFVEHARLPVQTQAKVLVDDFRSAVEREAGDITIIGMPDDFDKMLALADGLPGTVLFVADSGLENAIV
ncbi:amino acid permease [Anaeroselena agilis]|uniref:Na-K-Cl cotransporter n=1 Tax=Anaeroselena agilis TaxID=3063788 RepID=A0ABU3P2J7_9FIRM|nr:hypothetical protein [Selenomonadales bacterium 4137-cl]